MKKSLWPPGKAAKGRARSQLTCRSRFTVSGPVRTVLTCSHIGARRRRAHPVEYEQTDR
jgi:hypothetical protein